MLAPSDLEGADGVDVEIGGDPQREPIELPRNGRDHLRDVIDMSIVATMRGIAPAGVEAERTRPRGSEDALDELDFEAVVLDDRALSVGAHRCKQKSGDRKQSIQLGGQVMDGVLLLRLDDFFHRSRGDHPIGPEGCQTNGSGGPENTGLRMRTADRAVLKL